MFNPRADSMRVCISDFYISVSYRVKVVADLPNYPTKTNKKAGMTRYLATNRNLSVLSILARTA